MKTVASCAVAVTNLSFDKPYSYLLPSGLTVQVGSRVQVPFGRSNRLTEGIILDLTEVNDSDTTKYKSIASVQEDFLSLDSDFLQMAFWLRKRCYCTLFDVIHAMVPSTVLSAKKTVEMASLCKGLTPTEYQNITNRLGAKSKYALSLLSDGDRPVSELSTIVEITRQSIRNLVSKGMISLYKKDGMTLPPQIRKGMADILPTTLAPAQKSIYDGLYLLAFSGKYQCSLLRGITGSGKTHIYIKLITDVLNAGKSALMLVPEISLTPQMIDRFTAVFGNRVACLHSALGDKERREQWFKIKSGTVDVVIGTRSAVFAPIPQKRLGIIILDEEHEPSYKSESIPRYHARDIAQYRASKAGILLLLGSATPSVETEYAARNGMIARFELSERFNQASLAEVEIVNKADDLKSGNDNTIGSVLQQYISETISRKEQCILFLNRRGRNRRLICTDCGEAVQCPNCTNALSYHGVSHRLLCHICGFSQEVPDICPSCFSTHILPDKAGTQLIEEEIQRLFPGASYLRMDADSTVSRGGHASILSRFGEEKTDILIGTQMVTKGLDFPNVTLVGVLDADMSLYASDFRAGERTFSLLTQVVGRSGRGARPGKAVLQSYSPQNPILLASAAQDFETFYRQEIALRQSLDMPPFIQLILILFSGEDELAVAQTAQQYSNDLKSLIDPESHTLLGPSRAEIYKANNRFRWSLLIKTNSISPLRKIVEGLMSIYLSKKKCKGVSIVADENPYDMV